MKQYSTSTLLLLGLAASIVAQYGIPDDDDDKPVVRTPLRFSPPAHVFKAPATTNPPAYQEQVRSFPENYEYRHEVPAYAELPAVFKTVVELREEPKDYDKPVVKVAAKPYEAPSSARIIFKDDSDSTYTPSTRFNLPITTTLIKDSYPSTRLQYSKESVPILKFLLEDDTLGNYRLETVTGDGTVQTGSGHLKDLGGKEGPVQVMSGSYSFTGDDGKVYRTDWTADELGFNAVGDHLPTTPAS